MEPLTTREAMLFGQLSAYRAALKEAIKGHPYAHLLHGRFQIAQEQGTAVFLGEPVPESLLAGFESAAREIAAMLPGRSQAL